MFQGSRVQGCLPGTGTDLRQEHGKTQQTGRSDGPYASRKALYVTVIMLLFCVIFTAPASASPPDTRQEIRCLLFLDGNPGYEERIRAIFEQANRYLEREGADMTLVPSSIVRQIEFQGDTTRKMLNELRGAAKGSPSDSWELAIAFTTGPLQGPNGEMWSGVIEKRESRHIIIKCLNYNTLLHEIGHALGLPHGSGIMLSTMKTGYVPMDDAYREALKIAKATLSARTVSYRYGTRTAAQKISPSVRLAQASEN